MSTAEATPVQESTRVHIRYMIRRDMPEVLAIEQASFQCPWIEEEFLSYLRERNTIGMVAEVGEKVVAFFIYELHEKHLTLLNLAVHPDYRRQGIGRCVHRYHHRRRNCSRLSHSCRPTRRVARVSKSESPSQSLGSAEPLRHQKPKAEAAALQYISTKYGSSRRKSTTYCFHATHYTW